MISFNKLNIYNFGSYHEAELDLQGRGFCLVTGKNNFKKDNAASNGVGKSMIGNAICFALTGETVNGLHSNLKNINAEDDKSFVELNFSVDRDNYKLVRYISPKSDLKIFKNDTDISGKGIRDSEKVLNEVLPDLNKELISSICILGQGMPNRFSSFSPSGRKELLEKLTKSDFMIEDLRARLADRMTFINNQVRQCEDGVLISNTQLTTAESLLSGLQTERANLEKPNFDNELVDLNEKLSGVQNSVSEVRAEQTNLETKLSEQTAIYLSQTEKKNESLRELLEQRTNNTTDTLAEKSNLEASNRALQQEINKIKNITDICPTCGQKIPGVVKPSTTEQEQQIARNTERLTILQESLNHIDSEYQKQVELTQTQFSACISEAQRTAEDTKKQLADTKTKLEELTKSEGVLRDKISQITFAKSNYDNRCQEIALGIQKQEEEIKRLTAEISKKTDEKSELSEHLAVLRKMETLIKRDFRGYLLANIISYIDKKAKDLCEVVFGTRELHVYLDGNALDIAYCGKMFDNLSGGEKQRVDLILQFAIRDMLNKYLNVSANMLILDEITDFLDKQSCGAVMNLLERELHTTESVFIISHHSAELPITVDSELHIVKSELGISSITT